MATGIQKEKDRLVRMLANHPSDVQLQRKKVLDKVELFSEVFDERFQVLANTSSDPESHASTILYAQQRNYLKYESTSVASFNFNSDVWGSSFSTDVDYPTTTRMRVMITDTNFNPVDITSSDGLYFVQDRATGSLVTDGNITAQITPNSQVPLIPNGLIEGEEYQGDAPDPDTADITRIDFDLSPTGVLVENRYTSEVYYEVTIGGFFGNINTNELINFDSDAQAYVEDITEDRANSQAILTLVEPRNFHRVSPGDSLVSQRFRGTVSDVTLRGRWTITNEGAAFSDPEGTGDFWLRDYARVRFSVLSGATSEDTVVRFNRDLSLIPNLSGIGSDEVTVELPDIFSTVPIKNTTNNEVSYFATIITQDLVQSGNWSLATFPTGDVDTVLNVSYSNWVNKLGVGNFEIYSGGENEANPFAFDSIIRSSRYRSDARVNSQANYQRAPLYPAVDSLPDDGTVFDGQQQVLNTSFTHVVHNNSRWGYDVAEGGGTDISGSRSNDISTILSGYTFSPYTLPATASRTISGNNGSFVASDYVLGWDVGTKEVRYLFDRVTSSSSGTGNTTPSPLADLGREEHFLTSVGDIIDLPAWSRVKNYVNTYAGLNHHHSHAINARAITLAPLFNQVEAIVSGTPNAQLNYTSRSERTLVETTLFNALSAFQIEISAAISTITGTINNNSNRLKDIANQFLDDTSGYYKELVQEIEREIAIYDSARRNQTRFNRLG